MMAIRFVLIICVFISCASVEGNKNTEEQVRSRSEETSPQKTSSHPLDKRVVTGRAVRIIDGDTFVLLMDNDFDTRVRLDGIDCPERRQAFSQRAKQTLSDLIFDQEINVYYDKKDGFGRVLGEVYIGSVNVNQEMIRRGMAWHYVKYSSDETLAELEREARNNRVGLWVEPNPVPPWEYRRN